MLAAVLVRFAYLVVSHAFAGPVPRRALKAALVTWQHVCSHHQERLHHPERVSTSLRAAEEDRAEHRGEQSTTSGGQLMTADRSRESMRRTNSGCMYGGGCSPS